LAFVDAENALRALPRVNALLAEELRWTAERSERELSCSREALEAFHPSPARPGPIASGDSLQLSPRPSTVPS
jgi:hypothetical protein